MIDYILTNWELLLAVVTGAHTLALAIVNLTPTPKDNEILAKVYSYVEILAGILTTKAKDTNTTTGTT